jgi:glycerol-3-phosphate acyltransferase PlsY
MPDPTLLAAAAIGYLLGSLPFGLLLTRLGGYGDIRQIGSGNIGATNVLRTGNRALAALTLLFDLAKGAVAVLVGTVWSPEAALCAAAAVVLGHLFPVWLGFRGGKGVATALGVLVMLAWPVALIASGIWLLTAILFRYASLASLIAAAGAAIVAVFFVDTSRAVLIAALACLVIMRHQANIRRLLAGAESRISLTKS